MSSSTSGFDSFLYYEPPHTLNLCLQVAYNMIMIPHVKCSR